MFNINEINFDNDLIITNVRQKENISKAIKSVQKAKDVEIENVPFDIMAIFIKNIMEDLASITGEIVSEDIINEIFSRFCLGK